MKHGGRGWIRTNISQSYSLLLYCNPTKHLIAEPAMGVEPTCVQLTFQLVRSQRVYADISSRQN